MRVETVLHAENAVRRAVRYFADMDGRQLRTLVIREWDAPIAAMEMPDQSILSNALFCISAATNPAARKLFLA